MNVLFLDFDGVPNSEQFLRGKGPIESLKISGFKAGDEFRQIKKIDHAAVSLLHNFVENNDAKIVFSTTWREAFSQKFLVSLLQNLAPIHGRHFIGATPSLRFHGKRGNEIGAWLSKNHVRRFIIFDDMETSNFLPNQQPYHIKTEYRTGLTQENIVRATTLLNQ